MLKRQYVKPEIMVLHLEMPSIICTSSPSDSVVTPEGDIEHSNRDNIQVASPWDAAM